MRKPNKNNVRVRGATFTGDVTVGGEIHGDVTVNGRRVSGPELRGRVRQGSAADIRAGVQDRIRAGREKAARRAGFRHDGDIDVSVTVVNPAPGTTVRGPVITGNRDNDLRRRRRR
jgi:hypothetical protein